MLVIMHDALLISHYAGFETHSKLSNFWVACDSLWVEPQRVSESLLCKIQANEYYILIIRIIHIIHTRSMAYSLEIQGSYFINTENTSLPLLLNREKVETHFVGCTTLQYSISLFLTSPCPICNLLKVLVHSLTGTSSI